MLTAVLVTLEQIRQLIVAIAVDLKVTLHQLNVVSFVQTVVTATRKQ